MHVIGNKSIYGLVPGELYEVYDDIDYGKLVESSIAKIQYNLCPDYFDIISKEGKIELIKSGVINLKDKLLKLAKTEKYYFEINSMEEAKKFDSLISILGIVKDKHIIEEYFKGLIYPCINIVLSMEENLSIGKKEFKITFDNILDYV